jgi:hypothetical protein
MKAGISSVRVMKLGMTEGRVGSLAASGRLRRVSGGPILGGPSLGSLFSEGFKNKNDNSCAPD